MKLRGLSVDGFGVLHDYSLSDLPDGLTILHGPNEAGKSTLLAFVRGVLFGFGDRRRDVERHAPLRGGKHGGRCVLEQDGATYVLSRRAGKRGVASLMLPSQQLGSAHDLERLLGGADAQLYRSVFAFSLTELQSFASLTTDAVRDRIFSAGVAGGGRPAREAAADLERRATQLVRPRGRSRAGELIDTIRELDGRIRSAREHVATYSQLLDEEARLTAEIDEGRRAIDIERRQHADLALLIELWPTWQELQLRTAELATLDATLPDPAAAANSDTLAELQAIDREIPLYEDDVRVAGELQVERQRVSASIEESLRLLGAGWSTADVTAFDGSIPRREDVRTWQARLDDAARRIEEAHQQLELDIRARHELELRETRLLDTRSDDEPPPESSLDDDEVALRRLRAHRADREQHVLEARRLQEAVDDRQRSLSQLRAAVASPPPLALRVAVWTAFAVFGGLSLWIGIDSARAPWNLLLTTAVFALAALLVERDVARARAARARQRQEITDLEEVIWRQSEQIVEEDAAADRQLADIIDAARHLRLPDDVTALAIEERSDQLHRDREARRAWDATTLELAAVVEDLERARVAVTRAEAAVLAARDQWESTDRAWSEWKQTTGLPDDLGPTGAADFFDTVQAVRTAIASRAQLEREIEERAERARTWEQRAGALLERFAVAVEDRAVGSRASLLVDATRQVIRRCDERAGLTNSIHELDARIDARLGKGQHSDRLRETLATGELDDWRQSHQSAAEHIETLDRELEERVRRHQDHLNERLGLEQSTDIVALELERNAAVTTLDATIEEWQQLVLARGLIEETLIEFERSRQPAVLASASALFAEITSGRYHRVISSSESSDLFVVDHRGERRAVDALSRGTAEQLYLCLRLGLAGEFARRSTELPMVMDDILVNFDPERADATARVLANVAGDQQILFFTCHPSTRDRLAEAFPDARRVELPRTDTALQMPVG